MTTDGGRGEFRREAAPTAETDEREPGVVGVARAAVAGLAWIVGVGMIVLGLLSVTDLGIAALLYLVPGMLITPRTRREVKELAAIWVGT